MLVERTAQIVIDWDDDLAETLKVFTDIQNKISSVCFNGGEPLSALALHKKVYHNVKGRLNAQMTCTAIRLTAGAYVAAKHNTHKITKPFRFKNLMRSSSSGSGGGMLTSERMVNSASGQLEEERSLVIQFLTISSSI